MSNTIRNDQFRQAPAEKNAMSPMLTTLLGITKLVNFEQPSNAESPMLTTP